MLIETNRIAARQSLNTMLHLNYQLAKPKEKRKKTEKPGLKGLKKNEIYLREPPSDLSFQELFKFLWVQGIGNVRDEHGQPQPWTDASLEIRFYELGYEIDKRTIQNWLSGSNKPSARNLHRLARVVSNDDTGYKRLWRDAFTLANVSTSKPAPEPQPEATEGDVPNQIINKKPKASSLPLMLAGIAAVSVLIVMAVILDRRDPPIIEVTNLKFCDEDRFDRKAKICTTNVTHFPAGTEVVFVSFNMPNAPDGQPFERRWYREGQLFLSKDGFMDSAWEDFTWIKNPNGHDAGKYDLRIIVNGRVTTGSFFLGEINEDHEWP